jgi:predicted oxidoreductase
MTQLLGKSALQGSPIAYGFWRFAGTDVKTARAKVETALEAGMTLMDHADIYGVDGDGEFGDAERLFGHVLKEAPHLQDQMTIATKGGIVLGVPYDSSTSYLQSAVEASLTRMGIDSIDLYQIHRPDFLGHPHDIAETLVALRQSGKIKEVGVSNYTPSQTRALQAYLPFPIATNQPEFSCLKHDPLRDGTLDLCLETQMTPLAWSPLAGGRLAWSIEQAQSQGDAQLVQLLTLLDQYANQYQVHRTSIALAWVIRHPSRPIPIIGTQTLSRIQSAQEAYSINLTRTEWNSILVAAQGEPLP